MEALIPIALLGWIPLVFLIFLVLPARKAVFFSFIAGWLLLPPGNIELPGFPDFSKATTISLAALMATAVFKPALILTVRPSWIDIPMLVWCLCPFMSATTNGLGAYDGFSAVVETFSMWGIPYLLGRVYIRKLEDCRELATWLFIAGLIYAVPALWEIRMSPQLARYVYGIPAPAGGDYADELGKWGSRPRVFMGSGLALGMFMTTACISGFWLWMSGGLKRLWGFAAEVWVAALLIVTLLCKNMGATTLLFAGLAALLAAGKLRTGLVIYALLVAAPLYITLRVTNSWSAESMTALVGDIHKARADSLQFRLDNENILVDKASSSRCTAGVGGAEHGSSGRTGRT